MKEQNVRRLQNNSPAIAALWHNIMACALAEKLNRTTKVLRDL